MQDNYESLSLAQLRKIAKEAGIARISTYKKAELIELLLKETQKISVETREVTEGIQEVSEESVIPDQEKEETLITKNRPRRTITDNRNSYYHRQENTYENPRQQRNRQDNTQEYSNQQRNRQDNTQEYSNQQRNRQDNTQEYSNQQRNRQDNNHGEERQELAAAGNNESGNRRRGLSPEERAQLENGRIADGFFEQVPDKDFGFIRCDNYLTGHDDIYVSGTQIKRFNIRTGDRVKGTVRSALEGSRWDALLYVQTINDQSPEKARHRPYFENLTPIFPDERLHLERADSSTALRVMDLFSPVGKGQRGMIVSPPKAGKTTLLKDIANSVIRNHPEMHIIILLIDERPEEVTDIKESIEAVSDKVEVIYSTFDELPEHHTQVAELVLERGKRMVEQGYDVMILLDSITRLTRAYNLTVTPSGRTLSGGLDPAALHSPKKFFGAARNMRDYGSLTILATALTDTGSRLDDMVFEEFKGTGNMEVVLDRKLSERRLFPAIDLVKSSTRRDDLLLSKEEMECMEIVRRQLVGLKSEEAVESLLNLLKKTKNNAEIVELIRRRGLLSSTIVRKSGTQTQTKL